MSELLDTLDLFDGEDLRLNGCACTEEKRCYLHAHIFPKLRAQLEAELSVVREQSEHRRRLIEEAVGWIANIEPKPVQPFIDALRAEAASRPGADKETP